MTIRFALIADKSSRHILQVYKPWRDPSDPSRQINREPFPKLLERILQLPSTGENQFNIEGLPPCLLKHFQEPKVFGLVAALWMYEAIEIQED
jgi:hypothetical protein